MEEEIVQCHDIAAAQEICMDFRRKIATYSESEFRLNMFIADTSFPLAQHVVPEVKLRRVQLVVRCVSTCEAWILFVILFSMMNRRTIISHIL